MKISLFQATQEDWGARRDGDDSSERLNAPYIERFPSVVLVVTQMV